MTRPQAIAILIVLAIVIVFVTLGQDTKLDFKDFPKWTVTHTVVRWPR